MKPPQVENIERAFDLAQCICNVLDRAEPWSPQFVDRLTLTEFNAIVANDWEHVWNENQCRRIMCLYVATRLD